MSLLSWNSWKADITSGLIVLVPVLVIAYILAWLYRQLASVPFPVESGVARAVLALVVFVLLVFAVGYLMRTAIGNVFEDAIDNAMNQVPGLRVVYNASKMAVETAVSGSTTLQRPVKVELWDGMRMTAFMTGKTTADGRVVLFVPTSPNISTGYVVEVEPEDVIETNEGVEQALTRVLSAGFSDTFDDDVGDLLTDQGSTGPGGPEDGDAEGEGGDRRAGDGRR